jgi:hypothetical protein
VDGQKIQLQAKENARNRHIVSKKCWHKSLKSTHTTRSLLLTPERTLPPEIDDYTAGSQHSSSSEVDRAERADSAAGAEPENEGSEDDSSNSGQLTTRKRKVSPSFQALRSPSAHRYTTKERIPDSPDSPPDWGGVEEERDSSEAESTYDHISDEGKGKNKEIILPRPPALVVFTPPNLSRISRSRNKVKYVESRRIDVNAPEADCGNKIEPLSAASSDPCKFCGD